MERGGEVVVVMRKWKRVQDSSYNRSVACPLQTVKAHARCLSCPSPPISPAPHAGVPHPPPPSLCPSLPAWGRAEPRLRRTADVEGWRHLPCGPPLPPPSLPLLLRFQDRFLMRRCVSLLRRCRRTFSAAACPCLCSPLRVHMCVCVCGQDAAQRVPPWLSVRVCV